MVVRDYYGDVHHSVQRVTEFVPGTRNVWHVDDSNLSFITNHSEWKGTDIIFDVPRRAGVMQNPSSTHCFAWVPARSRAPGE